jgi:hypothetical protein
VHKWLLLISTLVVSVAAQSAETLSGRIGTISGTDWSVADFVFAIDLRDELLKAEVRIGRIEIVAADLVLPDSTVQCGRIEISVADFACKDARFDIDLPGVGRRAFSGAAIYQRTTGAVSFELHRVPIAGGELDVAGEASEERIAIEFSGSALGLEDIAAIAGRLGIALDNYSVSGKADLSGSLKTRDGALAELALDAVLAETSLANDAGTIVAESTQGRLVLDTVKSDDGWQFTLDVSANSGEAYIEPVYANLVETPVNVSATGRSDQALQTVDLSRYSLELGAEFRASGALLVELPQGDEAVSLTGSVQLADASFETIYTSLLQVFAAGTLFGDMETAGTVSGTIHVSDNSIVSASLELFDIIADDQGNRFAFYDLDGSVNWPGPEGEAGDADASYVHWQGARIYEIPLGETRIDALLGGDDFELLEAVRIPTLDGALRVNRLAVSNYGTNDASALLDAELEPVQLGELTSAFGWPAFSGTLSGKLPLLQYDGETVTVGGTLAARAFDGDIEFANLRLEQPFGRVPRLYGDLRLRKLDLEQVTDTFSFGLIQGRLSGDVTGLEMMAWTPTAMDLHVYTSPDDRSRRRISQRAVENLASVGGSGAAAALSGGFMSFFDEFSYKRIGLRCILADGTCRMSGAGPAGSSEFGQGYYIVEGSGLPRIDVVGYHSEVSWSRLVRQLAQIMESGAPTVN